MREVARRGGTFRRRAVDPARPHAHGVAGPVSVVVNCLGLAAERAAGNKKGGDYGTLTPARGHTVRVRAPFIDEFLVMLEDGSPPTYILPRGNGVVVLGGTHDENATDCGTSAARDADTASILARTRALLPSLAARSSEVEMLGTWTGLRPERAGGVMLGKVDAGSGGGGVPVLANYGHGGSGVTLAWGCAEEVVKLVDDVVGGPTGTSRMTTNKTTARPVVGSPAARLPRACPEDTLVTIRPGNAATNTPPLQLHVRTFGDPRHPALLIVNGIGAPKEGQPERALYQPLAAAGYFVVSFSNRDNGGSTRMDHAGQVSIVSTLALSALSALLPPAALSFAVALLGYHAARTRRAPSSSRSSQPAATLCAVASLAIYALYTMLLGRGRAFAVTPPYQLSEVAEDAVLLMDALGIARAHVMGTSMGGMLAQTMVIQFPARFLSLASCYSDTGETTAFGLPAYPLATLFRLYVKPVFLRPEPGDLEGNIAYEMDVLRFQKPGADAATWNGGEKDLRAFARGRLALQKRWDSPASRGRAFGRQMASIAWQAGDGRDTALQSCQVPAIVVHGMEDKLIPMEAGLHTARCLGGENCRKVVLVPGCGHSMDDKLARHIVDAVVENCRFADAQQEEKQQQQQQRQRGHTRSSMASRL
jgi:pimeloyl-ACP methyl ester carboxylesterase